MKKIIAVIISAVVVFSFCVGCNKKESDPTINVNIQPNGVLVETEETYDNDHMSFDVAKGWEVTYNSGYINLHKIPENEDDATPYIDFNVTELNENFLDVPNQEIVFPEYQYQNYEVYENRIEEIDGRKVHVLRYKATMFDEMSTVAYVKMYTFNDCDRTYSMAITSPEENVGIDEFYTTYCTFEGKVEVETTEGTTLYYPYTSGDFNAIFPTDWTSDPTGSNHRVEKMQPWLDKSFNNPPIYMCETEVDGFNPYISVLLGYQDVEFVQSDDEAFNLADKFEEYEQGEIVRSKKGDYDAVTLNYSALNEDGQRIYVKQIMFNTDDRLVIMSLYAPNTEFGVEEFEYMYDTIVIN